MQPGRARTSGLGVPLLPLARWVGWVAPVRPSNGVLILSCPSAALRVCSVLGRLAPVRRCARAVCCVASAVSWATWLLFTGVLAQCVVLRVRCPGALGSCFLGAAAGCVVVGAESWATWLLFTGAPARCVALRVRCPGPLGFLFTGGPAPWVVLRVRCPGPLGSCSPVCPLGVLCCAFGVFGHLAPVHRCARSVRCVVCAVSRATWLLFICAPARCVASHVRRPGPLGPCSPVCPIRVFVSVCGVLGLVAPVHRCAAPCVVLRVRCPGPLGSRSQVRPRRPLLCSCGVLGHLAPVHRSARSVCCFACAVSWATWLLFTGVPARCVVLLVRCPGPLGSCSPVRPLRPLLCLCGVPGHLAPVHRCARSVCCFACAVSWATWLLFTGVLARCVVMRVRCPGPLGSCSPVLPLGGLCSVYRVLGRLALAHRCAQSVCCALGCACGVAWAGRRCGALSCPSSSSGRAAD